MLGILKQLFALDSEKNTNSFVHQFITLHHWHMVYQARMLMLRNCNPSRPFAKTYVDPILQISAQMKESDVQKYV